MKRYRMSLTIGAKRGLARGRKPMMAVKSTSQRRATVEKSNVATLGLLSCLRGPKAPPAPAHLDLLDNLTPIDAAKRRRRCVLEAVSPQSGWKMAWDLFQFLLLLSAAFSLPLRLAFEIDDPNLMGWDTFVDVSLMLDVALNFCVAYHDNKGQLVTSFRRISLNYLKGPWPLARFSRAQVPAHKHSARTCPYAPLKPGVALPFTNLGVVLPFTNLGVVPSRPVPAPPLGFPWQAGS
jgi:hypothetical protein